MGQKHSTTIHLQEYRNVISKEYTKELMNEIPSGVSRVVILGIDLIFIYNPTDATGEMILHGLPVDPLVIPIPANMNQIVEGEVLYRHPKLRPSEIRKYAGLEESILGSPSKVIYPIHDPLIQFVVENQDYFKATLRYSDDGNFVILEQEFVAQVQEFFKNAIFGEIKYSQMDEITLESNGFHAILKWNYLEILEESMMPLKKKSLLF